MRRVHREIAQERVDALTSALADELGRAFAAEGPRGLQHHAELALRLYPGCTYIEVRDRRGQALARAFALPDGTRNDDRVRAESSRSLVVPGAPGPAPTVRAVIADESFSREMVSILWPLFWTLAFCLLVCEILAVLLARVLVGPIRDLVQAAHRLRAGSFDARARVHADDEVGQLAVAFNQMAESIEVHRRQLAEKEAARLSLVAKIVQAQEEERMVISRELHDQLGQSLSKVLLSLQSAYKECQCVNHRCGSVESEVRDAIDEVRRLAWSMRPSILDDFGLDSALGRYVQELSRRVEFPIDYQCAARPDAERLPSNIEVTLYRVAQEALTNIIRHAAPSRASVVLLRQNGEVTLMVEDDGRGFDTANGSNGTLGLIGMEERVSLIGGKLVIESRPGKGTAVRVRVPLGEAASWPSAS